MAEDMIEMAEYLGLRVVERNDGEPSGYCPERKLIRLTAGMSRRVTRSVLAHEIAHHVLDHHPTRDIRLRERQEREADEWAAQCLITPWAYKEVEMLREAHVPSMAHDLDVSPELVLTYQRVIERGWHRFAA